MRSGRPPAWLKSCKILKTPQQKSRQLLLIRSSFLALSKQLTEADIQQIRPLQKPL